mmetsp:Transcript_16549/g.29508  ORF Transcript_16549/g.29508 Transcript_16549/m.29508 type:complete len:97 (-) Transcript_16549:129-419(-)
MVVKTLLALKAYVTSDQPTGSTQRCSASSLCAVAQWLLSGTEVAFEDTNRSAWTSRWNPPPLNHLRVHRGTQQRSRSANRTSEEYGLEEGSVWQSS